jgi:hypothetical protein
MSFRLRLAFVFLAAALALSLPSAQAWNGNALRAITNKAVDVLPGEVRPFFEANRRYIVQHVYDPVESLNAHPQEKANHFIELDHYGSFPFSTLPRDYKSAVRKYGKVALAEHGLLPWTIGLYSAHLTDDFRAHNWDGVRTNAATLAYYVGEAHDPFNTTENDDGRLSGQPQVNLRFDASLFDRYSLFFLAHPNEAAYIQDPTDHAFEMCLTAHSDVEAILLADRRARKGLDDYTDEYYDRFYGQVGTILVRQVSDASTDVASYWLTSWVNAGKPPLPAQ